MLLLIVSFVAGVLTVLAPCILPLLPVVIGGSLTAEGGVDKKKVLTIVTSLGASVIIFTLLLKVSTLFINIPAYIWTWISGSIVIALGLIMIFPALWEGQWMAKLSAKSNIMLGRGEQKKSFWGDVIVGAALGPVFSTCSPTYFLVLATVLPVKPLVGFVYLLSYVVGLGLALFVVAFLGQKLMVKLNIAADPRGWFKRTIGILFLLVGLTIISGLDKSLQTSILNSGFFDVTKIEEKLLQSTESENNSGAPVVATTTTSTESKITNLIKPLKPIKAYIEIANPSGFVNSDSFKLADLVGKKVILLDFLTYSCINCQRTFPYLNAWYEKYKDMGLVIVGIHTPEFAFEKNIDNVRAAMKEFGITFPIVLDNDYGTWNAYGNLYWPRKYIIDIHGNIVYDHIGEGGYDETEQVIKQLLAERAQVLGMDNTLDQSIVATSVPEVSIQTQSFETYFGSNRNNLLANGTQGSNGNQTLTTPSTITPDRLYLGGTWDFEPEYAQSVSNNTVTYRYNSKEVYLVAEASSDVTIEVWQDGALVSTMRGDDVNSSGILTVHESRLYRIIKNAVAGQHLLELKVKGNGARFFTFTFG